MNYIRFLVGSILMCIVLVSELDARQMSLEDDLTVSIDYEKYQEYIQPRRIQRQINLSNQTHPYPQTYPNQQSMQQKRDHLRHDSGECNDSNGCEMKVCADPENEVYQECGSKCVLGCRYATISFGFSFTISKHDCEKNDCVEGCFCKTGLVRHQTKCIPASECPVRKCNHRYEVYMCGPAAPITCDNSIREDEISELTRHVECVWGCFCAQGYLRNNYNGKCVPEQECRDAKAVDISPQIPGLFKHITSDCGSGGCNTGCGPKGCGSHHSSSSSSSEDNESNQSHESGCGSSGCNNEGQWNNGNHNHSNGNGWPAFPGPVIHVHNWNDTGTLEFTGAPINGTCIGNNVCTGNYSGVSNNGPGSVSSGTPLMTVKLENGTTITSPVGSGGTVNLESGVINTGSNLADEEEEEYEDDYENDEVEEDDEDRDGDTPMTMSMTTKPQITDNFANAIINAIQESQTPSNGNNEPQTITLFQPTNGNPINAKPTQMVTVTPSNKPIDSLSGNQPSTYTPLGNGNSFPSRPQQLPAIHFPNQQVPNNAIQNPFAQFNNYPASQNFGYSPNFAHNIQPYASPLLSASQQQQLFVPANFFNRPIIPNRFQVANTRIENKDKEIEYDSDEEQESDEDENESPSEKTEQNGQSTLPMKTVNLPVQTLGNRAPSNNQQPYFNLFNQFNQNPNQYTPNQYQINPNHFNPYNFNPNQFNQNPFYANNFPNTNGFPLQFSSPNAQFNPFSNNNPFNTQSTNAFSNQPSSNYGGLNKQENPVSHKQNKKPHRKQQVTSEKPSTPNSLNQFNTFNRKVRPFSAKQDAEQQNKLQINVEKSAEISNDKIQENEKMRYILP